MDLMPKYKIPYLATIAATPTLQQKITDDYNKYKYFFRLGLNAQGVVMYLTQALDFMGKNFNFKRAYVVYQDVAWSQGTRAGVTAWLKANGWETVGDDVYPVGATEFTISLTKAKDSKADVLIPIFDMPQSGILLKQARAMQHPALLAGFISPVAPASAAKTFEGDVEGVVNLVFEIGSLPVKAVPASVQYNDAFGKKYGAESRTKLSGHGPGPSYDSVFVLKAAIERAGTLDGDALVTALEATDMDGVIGHIKFGKDHQVVFGLDPKTTALGAAFQWVKGTRVPVFPAVVAEGKIQLPSK
jgi:branched-chain amino acid transport system substrate-binding protein